MTPAEWVSLLIERAAELRKAGVRKLRLAGCTVEFAEAEPQVVADRVEEPTFTDPLDDPALYARHDGKVPGFTLRRKDDAS